MRSLNVKYRAETRQTTGRDGLPGHRSTTDHAASGNATCPSAACAKAVHLRSRDMQRDCFCNDIDSVTTARSRRCSRPASHASLASGDCVVAPPALTWVRLPRYMTAGRGTVSKTTYRRWQSDANGRLRPPHDSDARIPTLMTWTLTLTATGDGDVPRRTPRSSCRQIPCDQRQRRLRTPVSRALGYWRDPTGVDMLISRNRIRPEDLGQVGIAGVRSGRGQPASAIAQVRSAQKVPVTGCRAVARAPVDKIFGKGGLEAVTGVGGRARPRICRSLGLSCRSHTGNKADCDVDNEAAAPRIVNFSPSGP